MARVVKGSHSSVWIAGVWKPNLFWLFEPSRLSGRLGRRDYELTISRTGSRDANHWATESARSVPSVLHKRRSSHHTSSARSSQTIRPVRNSQFVRSVGSFRSTVRPLSSIAQWRPCAARVAPYRQTWRSAECLNYSLFPSDDVITTATSWRRRRRRLDDKFQTSKLLPLWRTRRSVVFNETLTTLASPARSTAVISSP